tara:strand:- start:171 stop:443 length:273 start_codon:yes stop_codon:yes gene_type:complete
MVRPIIPWVNETFDSSKETLVIEHLESVEENSEVNLIIDYLTAPIGIAEVAMLLVLVVVIAISVVMSGSGLIPQSNTSTVKVFDTANIGA